jgi:hypothetical protein
VLRAPHPARVDDVVERLRAIEEELPTKRVHDADSSHG